MSTTIHKGTALITGASSGIGAIYADRLAKAGYDLILVARRADRLNELARRLTDASGRSIETLAAESNARLIETRRSTTSLERLFLAATETNDE